MKKYIVKTAIKDCKNVITGA